MSGDGSTFATRLSHSSSSSTSEQSSAQERIDAVELCRSIREYIACRRAKPLALFVSSSRRCANAQPPVLHEYLHDSDRDAQGNSTCTLTCVLGRRNLDHRSRF